MISTASVRLLDSNLQRGFGYAPPREACQRKCYHCAMPFPFIAVRPVESKRWSCFGCRLSSLGVFASAHPSFQRVWLFVQKKTVSFVVHLTSFLDFRRNLAGYSTCVVWVAFEDFEPAYLNDRIGARLELSDKRMARSRSSCTVGRYQSQRRIGFP